MIGARMASDRRMRSSRGAAQLGEKAAVVGRQADGGVALVDLAAECSDLVVVAAGEVGEGVAVFGALGDVVAHGLAQAVIVVAAVVDGQQVAVLGVEEEEEAVEEDERGLAHVFQLGSAFAGEGANQGGIDAFEDDAGEVFARLAPRCGGLRRGRLRGGLFARLAAG